MKHLLVRVVIVNFSPALKRAFWWQPEIYQLISASAVFASIRFAISKTRALSAALVLCWVTYAFSAERAVFLYLPILFVWSFIPSLHWKYIEKVFWRLRLVFLVSVGYGLFQKSFGYLPHELGWIYSGIGAVREAGYFVTEEIRAFSFFAGIPEFGFFSAIMLCVSIQKKSVYLCLAAIFGIFLAGSRGIMISTVIGLFALFLDGRWSRRKIAALSVLIAIVAYLVIALVVPASGFLETKNDESRLFIYGTFNYRVSMILDLIPNVNLENIWFGIRSDREIFDNFFITLLNDVGLVGLAAFLAAIIANVRTHYGLFVSVLSLSYCLYADAFFSIYFGYNALVLLHTVNRPFLSRTTPSNTNRA